MSNKPELRRQLTEREAERNNAWGELREIRKAISANPEESTLDEVVKLCQQLAAKQAEVDALMLEYCPSEMSQEQLDTWAAHQRPSEWKTNDELRQQLAERETQVTLLRDAIEYILEYWNGDNNAWAMHDALNRIDEVSREALAATADLENVRLCEKEPVAEVKKHTGSLKDMAIIVWSGEQPAEGTKLYRAWEPKRG